MTGQSSLGRTVKLRPFLGVMGMPPDEPGIHSTIPPRATGGNLDCRELVSGSTLYLPIAVPGGLFSTGDGHAAQGDGEVSGTAIECPMESAELTFRLRDDLPLMTPIARTPTGWVTLGVHGDLDTAALIALNAMLDLLGRELGLSRRDALAVASIEVDLRVTQMVNEVQGVHARWRA
jgi:acetamidase/formamidase